MLIKVLRDPRVDPYVSSDLIFSVVKLGPDPRVIGALGEALRNGNVFVRRNAASGLGELGPVAASATLPYLKTALQDTDQQVREMAAAAIQRVAPKAEKTE